jgi:soluble lytic murein transglycosylase
VLIDPDAWSAQRRAVARSLAVRDPAAAYDVLAGHSAQDRLEISEIEFEAGWVALRLLDDPVAAIPHFERIAQSSSLPLSQSRAAYWLGRSHELAGAADAAEASYRLAAGFPTTFYGQLALARLGETMLPIAAPPVVDDAAEAAFLTDDQVKAMGWLDRYDRDEEVELLARFLADSLPTAAGVAQLAAVFEQRGDHQLVLQIGKLAANRGLPVDAVAFATAAIPAGVRSDRVEMALVYAVARQESAFDTNAVSTANARGLLQIQPDTAREAARSLGLPFAEERLTADPGYNAILGGAYLRTLLDRYDGSLVLAMAAYNAGLSRVDEWLGRYGDPRRAGVDPIDWIERIPFAETRNYVQRVIENLQVYRAILGEPELKIAADLGL